MKSAFIEYGDTKMEVEVPDNAMILTPDDLEQDPPAIDPYETTRRALENPLRMPPLRELGAPGKKAIILCPDRVKDGAHKEAHRRVCIPLIVEELIKGGVNKKNIKLMICSGLHRKNTKAELDWYLGKEIVGYFWPDRLTWHDAEDQDKIANFGFDELGDVVEVNKDVVEADIAVSIGHVLGNPYGGYSGGYKMIATGMTTSRSIRCHHCPDVMHAPSFMPINVTENGMRKRFDAIGKAIEKGMDKKFFFVDAVLGTDNQILGVYTGDGEEVQKESWKLANKRTEVYLDIKDKFDVLVFGEPRIFHYGPGHGTNPILMLQAIGAQLTRDYDVFNDNGVIICASLCSGWFNDEWFPSYREVYDKLQEVSDFAEIVRFEDEVSSRPEYIYKYRFCYSYGAYHAFSMVACGTIALKHTSAIFIPGAHKPGYARGMGCIPTNTFEDALREAEKFVGKNPRILVLPGCFVKPGFHLFRK
ncbi:Lactate racemase [subsurface metagenome]